MILSWIHKCWKYFWTLVLGILVFLLITLGGSIGLMQMKVTKNYLANQLEQNFSDTYPAELSIGQLNGLIPFNVILDDVSIKTTSAPVDSVGKNDTLASLRSVSANLDVLSLLRNKISITGFSVVEPNIYLSGADGEDFLFSGLFKKDPVRKNNETGPGRTWFSNIEIIAPRVNIEEGSVFIEKTGGKNPGFKLPEPLRIENINAEMFLEITSRQRFWNIESLTADVHGMKAGNISLIGQVYNDDTFLEFNGFTFKAGSSEISLSGEIAKVDLLKQDIVRQLLEANYDVDISSSRIVLDEFSDFKKEWAAISEPLNFGIDTKGNLDSLQLNDFSFGIGESNIRINGLIKQLTEPDELSYDLEITEGALTKKDLELFTDTLRQQQYNMMENLAFRGSTSGSLDSLSTELNLQGTHGNIVFKGNTRLTSPYRYSGTLEGREVNVAPLFKTGIDTSSLNFEALYNGVGKELKNAFMDFTASVSNSRINNIPVNRLEFNASLVSEFLQHRFLYEGEKQHLEGEGWIDFAGQETSMAFKGYGRKINLALYKLSPHLPESSLNFNFDVELEGLKPDRMYGRASLDVKPSVISGDTLQSHQMYMDLNSPDTGNRNFRFTSSAFDLSVKGDVMPVNMANLARHWEGYLNTRFNDEILLDSAKYQKTDDRDIASMTLEGNLKVKDLSLLQHYWKPFPAIQTDMQFTFNVNADSSRLLFSTEARSDSLKMGNWQAYDSNIKLTAGFQYRRDFKEFSNVVFQSDISRLNTSLFDMDSIHVDLAYSKDSLDFKQNIGNISDNASMELALSSNLSDSMITVSVDSFFLGNEVYAWQNEATPRIQFNRADELSFIDFSFRNREEFFEASGTLSPDVEDSLQFAFDNVNLTRISDLVDGRVGFAGMLNGNFQTRSLNRDPSIQGDLTISEFQLNNRIVGDATFSSVYNADKNRFDTHIRILTDSTNYKEYLETNNGIGQDIVIDGYFKPPRADTLQESTYNFDIDFKQIDMWVVPLITENIFNSMEGQATGEGYFRGSFDEFDFHADFRTKDVLANVEFLNTDYFLSGPVELDRQKGLVLDSVQVKDNRNGTGRLWGTVDFNDFSPITFLDLNLEMNRLRFLDNSFDPDVPFFGSLSGTGLLKLSGSNTDLFLETAEPIIVTGDSKLSIPLTEETELTESSKFIRFVDSFDLSGEKRVRLGEGRNNETDLDRSALVQAIRELTFDERFDLDLRFNAPDNVNVELIFDAETGDILTAQGTGQLRITMQDEEVQMFGRYNVAGGTYNFVSGDIISRKLSLEGGRILWEGNPDNARLDINAIYKARPNIANLNAQNSSGNNSGSENIQRAPIDLVIEIEGTVSSVTNNYYFRLPNNLDLASNTTLSLAINEINRDEEEKFIQAVGILSSGEFIPSESSGQATSLSQNLASGSTVINPLLSNQVISPLLSNQINSLLNSDVSRFDINFNLNAYNEVDLGVAFSLYNDRIVLRREGQLSGGPESTIGDRIGDLNITYRLNRGLSFSAFHRQEQTLGGLSQNSQVGNITPSVDGVGLEAKLQFNSWKNVSQKVGNVFGNILGIHKKEEKKTVASDESKEEKNN